MLMAPLESDPAGRPVMRAWERGHMPARCHGRTGDRTARRAQLALTLTHGGGGGGGAGGSRGARLDSGHLLLEFGWAVWERAVERVDCGNEVDYDDDGDDHDDDYSEGDAFPGQPVCYMLDIIHSISCIACIMVQWNQPKKLFSFNKSVRQSHPCFQYFITLPLQV